MYIPLLELSSLRNPWEDRYKKEGQPRGDRDCRLGVKKSSNKGKAEPAEGEPPHRVAPLKTRTRPRPSGAAPSSWPKVASQTARSQRTRKKRGRASGALAL